MKLVIITSRVPWPLDKGDKLRIYHQIRYLSKSYEIELVAISSQKNNLEAHKELSKYCSKVHLFYNNNVNRGVGVINAFVKNKPLQLGYFYNFGIAKKIQKVINDAAPDYVYGQLIRVADYITSTDIPKVLDLQDAFSKGLQRRASTATGIMKYILELEYKRMLAFERDSLMDYKALSIITQADKDLLPSSIKNKTTVVPNGVDFNFFKQIDCDKKYSIVFTGNMSYAPNVKAAKYLVNEIMPIVWKQNDSINVLIAGASPNSSVVALASSKVKISGWLDDIRDAYSQSEIFIAPMQIGIGLQNKLLEAMAMKMPCITSELANNALKSTNEKEILISGDNNSELFAEHILTLINDKKYAQKIAKAGHDFVKKNYDWESAVKKLEHLFQ